MKISRSGVAALFLVGVFVSLVLTAGARKSETIDEGLFVAGGAVQVRRLDPNVDLSHPPLLRWVAGLPAVFLGGARVRPPAPIVPRRVLDLYSDKLSETFDYTVPFFYDFGASHDRVLFWARAPFAILGALLGWLVFAVARKLFGAAPALGALAAYVFTPEVLAHCQWAHSDLASALTLFLVALALRRVLEDGRLRSFLWLGAAMGLAVATKLTALILWPPILVVLLIFRRCGWLDLAKRAAASLAVFYLAIIAAYFPRPRLFGPHEFLPSDLARLHLAGLEPLLRVLPLPDTFLKGVVYTLLLGQHGQIAYFHGHISTAGWWYYFPAAIFLKYPTGLLLIALAGLVCLWRGVQTLADKTAWTVPPVVVLAAAMAQSIDIGVRSVLPIAPFLALWAGAALSAARRRASRAAAAILLASSVLSGALAYPNFLAYFNPLVGGTKAADKWLIDSNLDWGQSLPALAGAMKRLGISQVNLAYFGFGRPSYWGIRWRPANVVEPGWYAISRSYLSGWWPRDDPYGWLRRQRPVALPGGSIALFHVTEQDLGRSEGYWMKRGLEELYERHDFGAAADAFRRVLSLHPGHYGATYQLACALEAAGRRREARSVWEKMLAMAKRSADSRTEETARRRLEQPDDAAGDLMSSGLEALFERHDPAAAAEAFRKVLVLNPTHYGATFQLARSLDLLGRREEARPYWKSVLRMAEKYHDDATAATARERLARTPR